MRRRAFIPRLLLCALCVSASTSCEREEKIHNYKPFFSGLEGAKTQTPATVEQSKKVPIPEAEAGDKVGLIKENKDGSVTLISKSGRNLMSHILRTLADEEDAVVAKELKDQFVKQVLSEITRAEYRERNLDPEIAYTELKKQRKEIAKLFNRMPMGEYSPNVLMEQIGKNLIRVKLTGQAKKGMERWTGFDMILEKGNWRLRWFVP